MSIGAGYACVPCQTYLRPRKNEIVVLETYADDKPYKVWLADLWECPDCGHQVILGYGSEAVSVKHLPNFDYWVKRVTHTILGCPRGLPDSAPSIASTGVVLQERVTLDEAVLASVETYRNGCNYALYFDGNNVEIGYGCDGVLINLQTGHKRLLHDWFASQHDYGDKIPLHFRVPLPVSPNTILELKKHRPCDLCGAPYFKGADA